MRVLIYSFSPRKVVAMSKVVVKVKCAQCGTVKDIHAGEIAHGDHPMCDRCFMPMVPVYRSMAMQQLLKSIGAQKKFANDQMVRCSINGDAKGQEAWHGYGQALTWVISSIETQDTAEGLQNIVDVG